jgi:hypothetical protein
MKKIYVGTYLQLFSSLVKSYFYNKQTNKQIFIFTGMYYKK